MEARLDTSFEKWGRFGQTLDGSSVLYGRLSYDPERGISLELLEVPSGSDPFGQQRDSSMLFGCLLDGTPVTLVDCMFTKSSMGAGGMGLPTAFLVSRAVFGAHVPNVDELRVNSYTVELSSLTNWTCSTPSSLQEAKDGEKVTGADLCFRYPDPIRVEMPHRSFDLQISHGSEMSQKPSETSINWHAGVSIQAHDGISLSEAGELSWESFNLMSLLIGSRLSVRAVSFTPLSTAPKNEETALRLLYHQRGKHDEADVHPSEMLLPYNSIREGFGEIVDKWFARTQQFTLAANVYFGSQLLVSPAVNFKFLSVVQSLESYHRSVGTGIYMDQAAYDMAVQQIELPELFEGDHRQSLKNRLKYGNEHSLRKRLTDMLGRLPETVRAKVARDVRRFINRVVDTRNYFTHYDHDAQQRSFEGKDAFVASERLRVLLVANFLLDLGIGDEKLPDVLERNKEFRHWLSQDLPL